MDYRVYRLNAYEWIKSVVLFAVIDLVIAYFFYRSLLVFAFICIFYFPFLKLYKAELNRKRKKRLLEEFSEVLFSVSVGMKAGRSFENSFVDAYKDIQLFYGSDSLMLEEIARIKKGLELNITMEDLIEDLAARSDVEEIKIFSDICRIAKRNGGNITEVLINTANRIRDGICVDKEIETIITEKKLEFRIMEAVPFFILAYLEVTSVGYFGVLYEGIAGRLFMTICLIMYIVSVMLGNQILKME